MFVIDSLAVDLDSSENGRWFTYPGGGRFLIARYNNSKAEQMRSALTLANYEELQAGGEKAEELFDKIEAEVMANTILLDWDEVATSGSNGKPVKYTAELGFAYLHRPDMRDFFNFVRNNSLNRANYSAKAEEEVVEDVKGTAAS